MVAYARSSANLLTKLILGGQSDSYRWEVRNLSYMARVLQLAFNKSIILTKCAFAVSPPYSLEQLWCCNSSPQRESSLSPTSSLPIRDEPRYNRRLVETCIAILHSCTARMHNIWLQSHNVHTYFFIFFLEKKIS